MTKRFLFLCDELSGYMHSCIVRLVDSVPDSAATIVARPIDPGVPFVFPFHPAIDMLDRSRIGRADFERLQSGRPVFTYVSGWRDADYRRAGRALKKRCPVVMGSDNLWTGSARQYAMSCLFSGVVHGFASHIWVPGMYHYEYARRLGFPKERILIGLYTATSHVYEAAHREVGAERNDPKTILFVGRLLEIKGVRELVAAFQSIETRFPDWKLRIIGEGPLRSSLVDVSPRIEASGFIQPHDLAREFVGSSLFCLPSYVDHWAVVIHEACCAGLPIVATTECGAVSHLVHHGYNGFRCQPRNVGSLQRSLEMMIELPESTRLTFGQRSLELSRQFTTDMWVSKVLATLPGAS